MAKKAASAAVLDIPVAFGKYSSDQSSCSIGVTIPRENLLIAKADRAFCGCRLTGKFFPKLPDAQPDQGTLDGMDEDPVAAIFDVKGFRATAEHYTLTASFMKKSIDKAAIEGLAKKQGRLVVESIDDIESEDGVDPDGDGDEE